MATATANKAAPTAPAKTRQSALEKQTEIRNGLSQRLKQIHDLLPDKLKPQADRIIKVALHTFARKKELHRCTADSFIKCVVDGAELGLPVDGSMGYAVPFWNSKEKVEEAQFIPGYKGLKAIACRNGVLKDVVADVVCERDQFDLYREDGDDHLLHRPALRNRGEVIGAYARFHQPDGTWRYEWMEREELDRIMEKTKSRDRDTKEIVGPWVTDTREMQKKTVAKRGLKWYRDDPLLGMALDMDDTSEGEEEALPPSAPPTRRIKLNRPTEAPEPEAQEQPGPTEAQYQDQGDGRDPGMESQEQPEREPGVEDPAADELERVEAVKRIGQQIEEATSQQEIQVTAGVALAEVKEWIGTENYAALLGRFQRRFQDLAKPAPKRK
jgi:recombination protein RecT